MKNIPAHLDSWFSGLSLRRIITSNRFIPEVDGFRFVAILIVIVAHVYAQCGPLPDAGWFSRTFAFAFEDGKRGVYLFFTISGFILALPFARHHLEAAKRVHIGSYFKRRVTRLEPPYVVAMVLRAPLVLLLKHGSAKYIGIHLLASLLYVHSLVFGTASIINPPAWSLEVEIQFYLLAPILTALFLIRRKAVRRATLLSLILASGIAANVFISSSGRLSLSLISFFHYFLAGFLLCDLYLCGDTLRIPAWLWDVLGLCALSWTLFARPSWYSIALPFAAVTLYMAGFHGTLFNAIFSFKPISLIGGMCYSIYLTHSAVLSAITPFVHWIARSPLAAGMQFLLIVGSCCSAALIVGTVYFIIIERPCMDPAWPQKLAGRLRLRLERAPHQG